MAFTRKSFPTIGGTSGHSSALKQKQNLFEEYQRIKPKRQEMQKPKWSKDRDEFGKIKEGEYPNLVEEVSKVQKDDKGLFTTGTETEGSIHFLGPHSVSDTTRYPQGFSDWKGEIKEGDYLDETTHEAWHGVDVEDLSEEANKEGQKATGKRKVYNKKTGKYEDYKG